MWTCGKTDIAEQIVYKWKNKQEIDLFRMQIIPNCGCQMYFYITHLKPVLSEMCYIYLTLKMKVNRSIFAGTQLNITHILKSDAQ